MTEDCNLYSAPGSTDFTSLINLLSSVRESLALLVTSSEMYREEPARRPALFQISSRAGKEGKVTQTGLLPATSGPVITRPTRFNCPGFRTPNKFFMISSTWIFLG